MPETPDALKSIRKVFATLGPKVGAAMGAVRKELDDALNDPTLTPEQYNSIKVLCLHYRNACDVETNLSYSEAARIRDDLVDGA